MTFPENGDREKLRFAFGQNWQNFLKSVSEPEIKAAEESLKTMTGLDRLDGLSFLDAGCGSGLFSLAAVRLGASRVVSFDYDLNSVACAQELFDRYGANQGWEIRRGSVLDTDWLAQLGQFDVVYSWGVLHHTGAMWKAMQNIAGSVRRPGVLFISIYNDQGLMTKIWKVLKRFYLRSPRWVQSLMVWGYLSGGLCWQAVSGLLRRRPVAEWSTKSARGMNKYNDVIDWLGGYPFEAAHPDQVISYFRGLGFLPAKVVTTRGSGCNEFVFRLSDMPAVR